MQKITFNTGKPYTAHGQRITAMMVEGTNDKAVFYDQDRKVYGTIDMLPGETLTKEVVMNAYDWGAYETFYTEEVAALIANI